MRFVFVSDFFFYKLYIEVYFDYLCDFEIINVINVVFLEFMEYYELLYVVIIKEEDLLLKR